MNLCEGPHEMREVQPRTGESIYLGDHDTVTLACVDVREQSLQARTFGVTAGTVSVCFSPDGKRLASASKDMTVKVWSLDKEM